MSYLVKISETIFEINSSNQKVKSRFENYFTANKEADCNICLSTEEISSKANELGSSQDYAEYVLIHQKMSEYMLTVDTLFLHGSAIEVDGEAYIFTAPSGTGKSTHARLWREYLGDRAHMVNDDKPYLICNDDGIYVCGCPWQGKHDLGENKKVKLKAIAILNRGETNTITEVNPADVFEFLYVQSFSPTDPLLRAKTMQLLSRICKNVKIYNLICNMDQEAAQISYNGMK